MGCVTCTPAMEGVTLSQQNIEDSLSIMFEPNTITGDTLIVDPEPFINSVYDSIGKNAHLVFMVDAEDGRSYTFGDLLQRSKCWAQWLRTRGLGKGSIVSISSENNMDGFCIILGTWLSGAAANPINYNFTAGDIKTMFECTEPDIIYCSTRLEVVEKAVQALDKKVDIVTPGGKYPHIDIHSIMKADVDNFEPYHVENTKDHVASIMFTSGTTGIPKGIQIVDCTLKVFPRSAFVGLSPVMVTSPMFWVSNLTVFSYSLYGLKQLVIPKKSWNARDILHTIQTYKPASWFTGHSVLLDMAHRDFVGEYDLSSLKVVNTGGALLFGNQRREINEKVFNNKLAIRHIYGSTEVGIITKWYEDIDLDSDEYNSVGTLENGVTLKIMSPEGKQLGPRQEGEIWIKSGSMTPGYITLKRKVLDAMDENGWYHMGDLGYYDEKKLVYVVGRLKDILKVRGVQIAPVEIEKVLDEHPDVKESCVVGKYDVINGDMPVAFVVLKSESTVTIDELFDLCKDNLAEIKWPIEIRVLDALPKSAVGKILRGELEKMVI